MNQQEIKKTIRLHLDSKDSTKNNNSLNSNVTFFLKTPINISDTDEKIYLSVDTAEIPVSWYLINNTNNKLIYYINDINYTVYIPVSNYSGKKLVSVLNYLLVNIGVSFDMYNYKMTFLCDSPFRFDEDSTCLNILGFINSDRVAVFDGENYSLISDKPINLSGTKSLYFFSDINIPVMTAKSFSSILLKAPIDCSYGEIYFYNNYQNVKYPVDVNVISQIQIYIKDDDGQYIDFQGFEWSISLTFQIIKDNTNETVYDKSTLGINLLSNEKI